MSWATADDRARLGTTCLPLIKTTCYGVPLGPSCTTNKDFTSWERSSSMDDNVAVPIIDRVIHHSLHLYAGR